jgi:hypothetical protein
MMHGLEYASTAAAGTLELEKGVVVTPARGEVITCRSKLEGLATSEQISTSAASGLATDASNAKVATWPITPAFLRSIFLNSSETASDLNFSMITNRVREGVLKL